MKETRTVKNYHVYTNHSNKNNTQTSVTRFISASAKQVTFGNQHTLFKKVSFFTITFSMWPRPHSTSAQSVKDNGMIIQKTNNLSKYYIIK